MISFRALPFTFQQLFFVVLICALSSVAFIFDTQISHLFVYQKELISHGELWRLFTGHIFHTNGVHLSLNLLAIVLLWALHGQFYTIKTYALLFCTSALTTSVGIYFFSSDISQYVGLSGVLHGVFAWGAIMDIKHHDKTGYLLLLGVIIKIFHEQVFGASADIESLINATVAIDAHLWGFIGGIMYSLYSLGTQYTKHA